MIDKRGPVERMQQRHALVGRVEAYLCSETLGAAAAARLEAAIRRVIEEIDVSTENI